MTATINQSQGLNADTITDEQIRELRDNGPRTADVLYECDLTLFASRGEFGAGRARAAIARARCVEILNARAKEG